MHQYKGLLKNDPGMLKAYFRIIFEHRLKTFFENAGVLLWVFVSLIFLHHATIQNGSRGSMNELKTDRKDTASLRSRIAEGQNLVQVKLSDRTLEMLNHLQESMDVTSRSTVVANCVKICDAVVPDLLGGGRLCIIHEDEEGKEIERRYLNIIL